MKCEYCASGRISACVWNMEEDEITIHVHCMDCDLSSIIKYRRCNK